MLAAWRWKGRAGHPCYEIQRGLQLSLTGPLGKGNRAWRVYF